MFHLFFQKRLCLTEMEKDLDVKTLAKEMVCDLAIVDQGLVHKKENARDLPMSHLNTDKLQEVADSRKAWVTDGNTSTHSI